MGTVRQSGLLYAQHRNCVYSDNDFINEARLLRKSIGSNELGLASNNEEDYISSAGGKLADELQSRAYKVAEKYAIRISDLIGVLNNTAIDRIAPEAALSIDATGLSLRIEAHTTLNDIKNIWSMIEAMKSIAYDNDTQTKKKLPENPRLIYAMFKARREGLTYRKIFEAYQKQKLPAYEGPPIQFKDEESLERYYQKYKPAT